MYLVKLHLREHLVRHRFYYDFKIGQRLYSGLIRLLVKFDNDVVIHVCYRLFVISRD